jgi:hypothetical protein
MSRPSIGCGSKPTASRISEVVTTLRPLTASARRIAYALFEIVGAISWRPCATDGIVCTKGIRQADLSVKAEKAGNPLVLKNRGPSPQLFRTQSNVAVLFPLVDDRTRTA